MFLSALLVTACLSQTLSTSSALTQDIEIVVSLPYKLNLALDVVLTGPAFDLAAAKTMMKYGDRLNVTITYLYNKAHRNCNDLTSETANVISEYYYRNVKAGTCYAVVTSACNDQTAMWSLVNTFDWVLFSNVLVTKDFFGSPSVVRDDSPGVAVGGAIFGYGRVLLDILTFYEWLHVTVLVEAKAFTPFYKDVGNVLEKYSRIDPVPFVLEVYTVDCRSLEAVKNVLGIARTRSRVIILLTTGGSALQILKIASRAAMTNGEYVFFSIQPLQSSSYGVASLFDRPVSKEDAIVARSLFFLAYRPAGDELEELNRDIADRTRESYGVSYPNGSQPLDSYAVRASYDIVELFAATANETVDVGMPLSGCSGLSLARKMANKTFVLSTGDLYISSKRARNLDLDIFGLNQSTKTMQLIGKYEWAGAHLTWNNNRSRDWPSDDQKLPHDVPLCGFSGTESWCAARVTSVIVNAVVAIVVVAVLLAVTALLFRHYAKVMSRKSSEAWWRLDTAILVAIVCQTSWSRISYPRYIVAASKKFS